MKILFINLPFSGHIMPTLGLVKELQKRNNYVTYLLTYEWEDRILKTGVEFAGYKNAEKLSDQIKNAYSAANNIASEYDLIIYEQFFFLGKHLAEKHNKPVVRIFTSLASNETLMKEYVNAGGMLGVFRSKWICRNWTKDVAKGIELKTDCWLKEIIQNPPNLNLVYTIKDFQPFADEFSDEYFKFIGASIYQRDQSDTFILPHFDRPLIYISLGTIVNKEISFYKKCIRAFGHESVAVIMSVGNMVNIDSLGTIPNNFYIYPFVPQLEVLKASDVFITHGGLNSVTEALFYGVPMAVIPFMTDQPVNARRIEELHLGKKLEYRKITSKLLNDTVFSILDDPIILESTSDMQSKMKAIGGNEYGAELIMEFYIGERSKTDKFTVHKTNK